MQYYRVVALWHFGAFFLLCTENYILMLLKDLDVFPRNRIKDELVSLDPLSSNFWWGGEGLVGTGEGERAMDDYDQYQ